MNLSRHQIKIAEYTISLALGEYYLRVRMWYADCWDADRLWNDFVRQYAGKNQGLLSKSFPHSFQ